MSGEDVTWGMTTLSVVLNWVLTSSWTRGDSANPPTRNRWDTLQTRSLAHFLFAKTTFGNNFARYVTVGSWKIKISSGNRACRCLVQLTPQRCAKKVNKKLFSTESQIKNWRVYDNWKRQRSRKKVNVTSLILSMVGLNNCFMRVSSILSIPSLDQRMSRDPNLFTACPICNRTIQISQKQMQLGWGQRVINCIIGDQAFSSSSYSAPPSPLLSSQYSLCLRHRKTEKERQLANGRDGEEPNHTTAVKPYPL